MAIKTRIARLEKARPRKKQVFTCYKDEQGYYSPIPGSAANGWDHTGRKDIPRSEIDRLKREGVDLIVVVYGE